MVDIIFRRLLQLQDKLYELKALATQSFSVLKPFVSIQLVGAYGVLKKSSTVVTQCISRHAEADAGQTTVSHKDQLERESTEHDNNVQCGDIWCLQKKLNVATADYQKNSSTTSTMTTAPTIMTITKR